MARPRGRAFHAPAQSARARQMDKPISPGKVRCPHCARPVTVLASGLMRGHRCLSGGQCPGSGGFPPSEAAPAPVFGWEWDTPIHEMVGQLVGAASMCWSNPAGAGVFNSTRAAHLVDEFLAALEAKRLGPL